MIVASGTPNDLQHEASQLRSGANQGDVERLIVSHYENNYGGAVKRLNLIEEKLAELDYANAPGFASTAETRAAHRDELDDPP